LVVVTEYPDPLIMNTLEGNVERARLQRGKPHPAAQGKGGPEESEEQEEGYCTIECAEYEWGSDVSHLLLSTVTRIQSFVSDFRSNPPSSQFLPHNAGPGFDIVIMSDLLHFDSSHTALVDSLIALLSKSDGSRAYVAAGRYTKQDVCDRFINQTRLAGIELVEESHHQGGWQGQMAVRGPGLDLEGLRSRRDMSRLWVGRWTGGMTE
jgi:nicotinamide N-methyltransferase